MNLVEAMEEGTQAPCKHGNIIAGHACYCHSEHKDAPRKCPIWRNGEEWSTVNCELFEVNDLSTFINEFKGKKEFTKYESVEVNDATKMD